MAGQVAFSGQTVFIDSAEGDNRFDKEVDDPKGSKPRQIIAVPVFCSTDRFDTSLNSLSSLPRAIISVISKHDPNGFS